MADDPTAASGALTALEGRVLALERTVTRQQQQLDSLRAENNVLIRAVGHTGPISPLLLDVSAKATSAATVTAPQASPLADRSEGQVQAASGVGGRGAEAALAEPTEAIVTLNVGGQLFTTRRSTLCSVSGSFLANLLGRRFRVDRDSQGHAFVDRSPKFFGLILDWLRDRAAPHSIPEDGTELDAFYHELDYYGLTETYFGRGYMIPDCVFVVGGWTDEGAARSIEIFYPGSSGWEVGPQLPLCAQTNSFGRCNMGAAVVGDRLYVIGGSYSGRAEALAVCDIYLLKRRTWVTGEPMSVPRYGHGIVASGDKIFVLGGETTDSYLMASGEVYHADADTWHNIPPLTHARSYFACVQYQGRIYVAGGWGSSGSMTSLEIYDMERHVWMEGSDMPTARHLVGAANVGGKIYVVAGAGDHKENVLNTVECYDTAMETWKTCAPLPVLLKRLQCVAMGGCLHAIGGEFGGAYQPLIFTYDPVADAWSAFKSPLNTARSSFGIATVQ